MLKANDAIKGLNIMWFRHGLRLHDNPSLLHALIERSYGVALLPIFIFDGESAGTKCMGYNRACFLLDSLYDLHQQFVSHGGKLYLFEGNPVQIFRRLHKWIPINKICFEEDCEPIWQKRDNAVRSMCQELNIECIEEVSHTLWNPRHVIDSNGKIPPLTYQMFLHTVQTIGLPPSPAPQADLNDVLFVQKLSDDILKDLKYFQKFPTAETFNIFCEVDKKNKTRTIENTIWKGGETEALFLLKERLKVEENAFKNGFYLPNQCNPNILEAPKSMSAHLRFGCLSVRRFYWNVHDLFKNVQLNSFGGCSKSSHIISGAHITGQLIWREYFYTMSVNNINYDRINGNDICLKIPWKKCSDIEFDKWKFGKTGYPLIDASMRQLLSEGWLHHTLRNATATFLTRGALWLSWEHGLEHFLKYLIDADWSVCAGNWMWVSSSAFERLLDTSIVTCPVSLAKRLDPQGVYIKKYIPELFNVPPEYVHEPWRMSLEKQKEYECVLGQDYPERMVDLNLAAKRNNEAMETLRNTLMKTENDKQQKVPPHCRPSNEKEVRHFFWVAD